MFEFPSHVYFNVVFFVNFRFETDHEQIYRLIIFLFFLT